jgi:hypothetical protein
MRTIKFLIVVLTFASATFAQVSKASTVTNPGVKAEFVFCAAGDTACENGNRARQDKANSPYIDALDGVSAVFNLVSGSNDLTVNLNNAKRTVHYDFREIAAFGNPQPAWWYSAPQQDLNAFINVLGAYNAKLQCGGAATCDINYITGMNGGGFTISRVSYALQWHPASTQPYINTPETTSPVNVHYVKDAAGEVFTITPLPNANTSRSIAGLQGTSGKTASASGQYVMPFTLTVHFK